MQHSNWWLTTLTVIEILSQAAVAAAILHRRLLRAWPSLFTACTLDLVLYIALLTLTQIRGHYRLYFYSYWISSAVVSLVRFWITADIIRSMPGIGFLPRRLFAFIASAAVSMAIASAAFCFYMAPKITGGLIGTVILIDRAVNIAWIAFFLAMLGATNFLCIGWSPLGARITCGIVLRICSAAAVAEMISHTSHSLRVAANGLEAVSTIAVLLLWAFYILRTPPIPDYDLEGDTPATRYTLELLHSLLPNRER